MAKPAQQSPTLIPISLKACAVFKTDNGQNFLCEAVELEIVDGVVVAVTRLNRGPDLPASAMGNAQRVLWSHFKSNKHKGQ